jgi:hypothetical protein
MGVALGYGRRRFTEAVTRYTDAQAYPDINDLTTLYQHPAVL